jgi:hypothetical protein
MPSSLTFAIGQKLARRAALASRATFRGALVWIAAVGLVLGAEAALGRFAFDKLDCLMATAPLRTAQ